MKEQAPLWSLFLFVNPCCRGRPESANFDIVKIYFLIVFRDNESPVEIHFDIYLCGFK